MQYYTGSYLDLRFTTQHACGIENQCEIIIQYGCNMRNGNPTNSLGNTCTRTMPDINNTENFNDNSYGYHESFASYNACKLRTRNLNLYTGDQVLRGNSAIYTRQNPNGERFGFECPEERDYYPYWAETPWRDIAIMTSNTNMCDYYLNYTNQTNNTNQIKCLGINNTQVNRLGATYEGKSESSFLWKLPEEIAENCVLRIRYNISLPTELDWFADTNSNKKHKTDPLILVDGRYVRLALDTAQLPRTFEDRSYTFNIIKRPLQNNNNNNNNQIDDIGEIYNINVQGKRGNIAQVRNCFEYDFVPNNLTITEADYVHFQWVGSDFNPLNNNGEGRAGTDRSNLVEIMDYFGYNRTQNNTFIPADLIDSFVFLSQLEENCYTYDELILLGKIKNTEDLKNCALLNNASVYFNSRLFRIKLGENKTQQKHSYVSTRNNNFSNRNQKGNITVVYDMRLHINKTNVTDITDVNPLYEAQQKPNRLSAGFIVLIIVCIIFVIFGAVLTKRNYRKIKMSFSTHV